MQPGTEAVRVSPSRKPARELCFSLHQHWWSSWWLCVRSLRGIVLATFPEIAFSLRSQRCVALFQMSHVSGRLLYLKSLICTEEQLLVEKSVTCVKSHQIPQLILVHTRQARRARGGSTESGQIPSPWNNLLFKTPNPAPNPLKAQSLTKWVTATTLDIIKFSPG